MIAQRKELYRYSTFPPSSLPGETPDTLETFLSDYYTIQCFFQAGNMMFQRQLDLLFENGGRAGGETKQAWSKYTSFIDSLTNTNKLILLRTQDNISLKTKSQSFILLWSTSYASLSF